MGYSDSWHGGYTYLLERLDINLDDPFETELSEIETEKILGGVIRKKHPTIWIGNCYPTMIYDKEKIRQAKETLNAIFGLGSQ